MPCMKCCLFKLPVATCFRGCELHVQKGSKTAAYQIRLYQMGGVWIFKDGFTQLVENPLAEPLDGRNMTGVRRKVLVHVATNESIINYDQLEQKLREKGWTRYYAGDPNLRQYHKSDCTNDLISLPKSFAYIRTMHMYDIVVKVPNTFVVRDS
ncbi:flowering-promoting factor 1 [Physcomitrium patens]|uniref:Flowering-promoting factor 1-like protein 3 n=1 Tax=Physcomitrium patens TaxID=3218 RepID=A0A2K1IS76_PHYPA|nr:flowering-promoting factor 1-like [Physcomitrium patens]PNR32136.1 hypothetical protein PHYPA_026261 [Physcomitrium patens]|eukprot:XP_024358882.1 flowering-promoting factor 1-like [Physcomitrella patens]